MKRNWVVSIFILLCVMGALGLALFVYKPHILPGGEFIINKVRERATVADRVQQYGAGARAWTNALYQRLRIAIKNLPERFTA